MTVTSETGHEANKGTPEGSRGTQIILLVFAEGTCVHCLSFAQGDRLTPQAFSQELCGAAL